MEEESRGETTQQTKQQTQGNPDQEVVDKVQEVGDNKAPAFEQMIADREAHISELETGIQTNITYMILNQEVDS